ncbi:MAG TPA: DUF6089 family protein [Flavobacteriaceae bacterium]|nr:DUF6089 family protein [Flavobacteriaceae bacterium]
MRYLTLAIVMLFIVDSHSQTFEIGPYIGGANYIGDIGPTTYIDPNTLLVGGIFKWNRSPRHSFRFTLLHAKIQADDADSNEGLRQERGLSFENTITEASLGIEYTFWEWNLHTHLPQITPYLYTGLTFFHAKSLAPRNGEMVDVGDNWNFSIPFVVGVKGTLTDNLILAAEIGPRYTFSDNLDGSNPIEITENTDIHPNTNDWYMFTGITLTYTFGRKPCYCNF